MLSNDQCPLTKPNHTKNNDSTISNKTKQKSERTCFKIDTALISINFSRIKVVKLLQCVCNCRVLVRCEQTALIVDLHNLLTHPWRSADFYRAFWVNKVLNKHITIDRALAHSGVFFVLFFVCVFFSHQTFDCSSCTNNRVRVQVLICISAHCLLALSTLQQFFIDWKWFFVFLYV